MSRVYMPTRGGFSLVELLVVIAVIAIIAAIAIPSIANITNQANASKDKRNAQTLAATAAAARAAGYTNEVSDVIEWVNLLTSNGGIPVTNGNYTNIFGVSALSEVERDGVTNHLTTGGGQLLYQPSDQ